MGGGGCTSQPNGFNWSQFQVWKPIKHSYAQSTSLSSTAVTKNKQTKKRPPQKKSLDTPRRSVSRHGNLNTSRGGGKALEDTGSSEVLHLWRKKTPFFYWHKNVEVEWFRHLPPPHLKASLNTSPRARRDARIKAGAGSKFKVLSGHSGLPPRSLPAVRLKLRPQPAGRGRDFG